jgi:hypothetical protein
LQHGGAILQHLEAQNITSDAKNEKKLEKR